MLVSLLPQLLTTFVYTSLELTSLTSSHLQSIRPAQSDRKDSKRQFSASQRRLLDRILWSYSFQKYLQDLMYVNMHKLIYLCHGIFN